MESKTKSLAQMHHVLHLKHMSVRTVEVYVPERKCKRSRVTVLSEAHPPNARQVTAAGGCAPLGCHAGRTHVGTSTFRASQARKDLGRDGAVRRAPRLACLRVILLPSQYSPALQLRGDAEAKMCFMLLRRSGSLGSAPSIYRGPLDTSTTDAKALRASAGLANQGMRVTHKEGRDGHDFALDLSRSGALAQ